MDTKTKTYLRWPTKKTLTPFIDDLHSWLLEYVHPIDLYFKNPCGYGLSDGWYGCPYRKFQPRIIDWTVLWCISWEIALLLRFNMAIYGVNAKDKWNLNVRVMCCPANGGCFSRAFRHRQGLNSRYCTLQAIKTNQIIIITIHCSKTREQLDAIMQL